MNGKKGVNEAWDAVAESLNHIAAFKDKGGITPKMARTYTESTLKMRKTCVNETGRASGIQETVSPIDQILDDLLERLDSETNAKEKAVEKDNADKSFAIAMQKAAMGKIPPPFTLDEDDNDFQDNDERSSEGHSRSKRRRRHKHLADTSLEARLGSFMEVNTKFLQAKIDECQKKTTSTETDTKVQETRASAELIRAQLERDKFDAEKLSRDTQQQTQLAMLTILSKLSEKLGK